MLLFAPVLPALQCLMFATCMPVCARVCVCDTLSGLRTQADLLLAYLGACVSYIQDAQQRGETVSAQNLRATIEVCTLDWSPHAHNANKGAGVGD